MKTAQRQRWAWIGLAVSLLAASFACAQQPTLNLDKRYPATSIDTDARAQQALADVATFRQSIDAQYKAETTRCTHVFLATECQDKAHRAHTLGESQAHRVEVEAHDLQRKLAAQERAVKRDEQKVQQQLEDAKRPEKERDAEKSAQQRADKAVQDEQDRLRQQAQAPANRESYERRNAQHDQDEAKRANVLLRNVAENERRFADKQTQAKTYAATRARERVENEKEREERERKRKADYPDDADDSAAPSAPEPKK
jgi:hypothetical protein